MDIAIVGPVQRAALDDYLKSVEGIEGARAAGAHLADAELTWATVTYQGEADDVENLQLVRDIRALQPRPAPPRSWSAAPADRRSASTTATRRRGPCRGHCPSSACRP
ncbi:hypothetical protein ACFQYP_18240 [Nonomuraea antimicrobica]